MNDITQRQNDEDFLRLLRARSQVYREAKSFQMAQLLTVVLLPMSAAVLGLASMETRPYVAAVAFAATLLDALWLDRAQRTRTKVGARLGEMFDCRLLSIDWNSFVAGKEVDAQTIVELEQRWSKGDTKLVDWYQPRSLSSVPLHVARVICQHTNLWYDGRLRRKVGTALTATAVVTGAMLCVAGLALALSFSDFMLTVVAPFAPLLTWTSREVYRQRDAAEALDNIKGNADDLWGEVVKGLCHADECSRRSREFQDAIFNRRASSPPHVPYAYDLLRSKMEAAMSAGNDIMLREYEAAKP